jgi:hypothetical protein
VTTRHVTILLITTILLASGSIQYVYANKIDSLTSREAVRKFLVEHFNERGILGINRCIGISPAKRLGIFFPIPYDTIEIEDPVTREFVLRTMPRDTSYLWRKTTKEYPLHIPPENILNAMEMRNWQFYKADIDGNGFTDILVDIDTYGVFTMMDMGDRYEGHILGDSYDFHSYAFRDFITLPDGSNALLLRRNPCTLDNRSFKNKTITYLTRPGNDNMRMDTLYKIVMIADSIYKCRTGEFSYLKIISDTVDIKRYNKTDTIVFKFNGFARYNSQVNQLSIDKIGYYFYGSCMEIHKNGEGFLRDTNYDTTFFAQLGSNQLSELWDYATYLNIQSGEYDSQGALNRSAGAFVLYFSDGTEKELVFSTGIPPMGLGYLSVKLAEAGYEMDWQPMKKYNNADVCKKREIAEWEYTVDCAYCYPINRYDCN